MVSPVMSAFAELVEILLHGCHLLVRQQTGPVIVQPDLLTNGGSHALVVTAQREEPVRPYAAQTFQSLFGLLTRTVRQRDRLPRQ